MKINEKKSMEGGMWWIIVAAIIALVVAGIVIYIIKEGLDKGGNNINRMSSCRNQGGECKSSCDSTENRFYKIGDCGKDGKEDLEYCCIPKEE